MTTVIVRTQEELGRLKRCCTLNKFTSDFSSLKRIDRWGLWSFIAQPDECFLKVWFDGKKYEGYTTCWSPSTPAADDITVDEFINDFNYNFLGEIK